MNFKDDDSIDCWTRAQTVQLISEYKKHEILYRVSHPDYYTVQKKIQAFAQIVDALKPIKPKVSVKDIKKKIKVLNAQLRIEKRRMLAAGTDGNRKAPEEGYESTLWCFKHMQFLLNVNDDVHSASNIDDNSLPDIEAQSTANIAVVNMPDYSTSERKSNDAKIMLKKKRLNCFTDVDDYGPPQIAVENNLPPPNNHVETDVATELRQTARQSLELMHKFIKEAKEPPKPQESKEEIFCKMLCSELKQLKLEETYDEVTAELFSVIKKAKAEERKKISKVQTNVFDNSQTDALDSITIEVDPLQFSHRNTSKCIMHV